MNRDSRVQHDEMLVPRWFVMRAYKSEKMAESLLSGEYGLPYFIPKHYVLRTCHGRKQRRLVPVIPSVVFVRASRSDIQDFRLRFSQLPLQYVMQRSRSPLEKNAYLVVPDKEMEDFMRVAACCEADIAYYRPDEIALEKGCRVRVHGGKFDGLQGILLKVKGKRSRRVVVMLEGIAAVAAAEITPDLLEILPPQSSGCPALGGKETAAVGNAVPDSGKCGERAAASAGCL